MNKPTELEKFLRAEATEGKIISEGQFSISRDKALAKLAKFQLPFEGAWGLKVVQAAVASGRVLSLNVKIGRNASHFYLHGKFDWTLTEIETALLDPGYDKRPDILHLIAALRAAGLNDMRGFWLALPGDETALAWNGESLSHVPVEERLEHVSIQVTGSALYDEGGFLGLKGYSAVSERNASLTKSLTTMAHVCPVPLTVDGRRIDALEYNQDHGWSKESQLMCIGLEDSDLPKLPLPQKTGTDAVSPDAPVKSGLKVATENTRAFDTSRWDCSLAYLVALHVERVKRGKNYRWEDRDAFSQLNWVQDGVLVDSERISEVQDLCSAGAFVSAQGLRTDLTSFRLLESEARSERRAAAVRLLRGGLSGVDEVDFEKMYKDAENSAKWGGGVLMLLGLGSFFASAIHGFSFLAAGIWILASGGQGSRTEGERYIKALGRVGRNLRE